MTPDPTEDLATAAREPEARPPSWGRIFLACVLSLFTCPCTSILLMAESGRRVAPVPVGAAVMGAVAAGVFSLPFLGRSRHKLLVLGGALLVGALLGLVAIPFIVG